MFEAFGSDVWNDSWRSNYFQLLRRCLALIGHLFILNRLPLMKGAQARLFNGRDVNENVPATSASRLNKPVPLGRVEPLHCALGHNQTPLLTRLRERCLELVFLGGTLECFGEVLIR
jgi:hypothetical protein